MHLTDTDLVRGATYDLIMKAARARTADAALPVSLPRATRNSGAHPAALFKNWSAGLCGLRVYGETLTFSASLARLDAKQHGVSLPDDFLVSSDTADALQCVLPAFLVSWAHGWDTAMSFYNAPSSL